MGGGFAAGLLAEDEDEADDFFFDRFPSELTRVRLRPAVAAPPLVTVVAFMLLLE